MSEKGLTNWKLQLFDKRTGLHINDDSGVAQVLGAGTAVEATIYSNLARTAATNPLTFTDGLVEFWTLDSVTSVDISILTAAGDAIFLNATVPGLTKVEVDTQKMDQRLVIALPFNDDSVADTGFDLPANMLLKECYLHVITTDAETLDVGILAGEAGGDEDGFLAAISVAAAGIIRPIVVTNGSSEAYVSSFKGGVLMYDGRVGTDTATDNGLAGTKSYITDGTAKSIVHTGSAGSDTFVGYLILEYDKLPVA